MAPASWQQDSSVEGQLFTEAYRFEFYQAVRLLEVLIEEVKKEITVPLDLRYVANVSAAFPASNIDQVQLVGLVEMTVQGQRWLKRVVLQEEMIQSSERLGIVATGERKNRKLTLSDLKRMPVFSEEVVEVFLEGQLGKLRRLEVTVTVNFMGLAGAHGPLPMPYTELILERVAKKDTTLRDFLDLFNHRLVSLFYRARQTQRVGLETGAPWQGHFPDYLLACMGLGMPSWREKLLPELVKTSESEQGRVAWQGLLFYAGLFAHQSRSLAALENLLSDFFQVPVSTVAWLGQWRNLPDESLRLGKSPKPLRDRPVVGTKIWDQQSKFGLYLGPLDWPTFLDFLPDGQGFKKLEEVTRLFVGSELEFEVNLKLMKNEIPKTRLSCNSRTGAKLGRTSWVKTRESERDALVRVQKTETEVMS